MTRKEQLAKANRSYYQRRRLKLILSLGRYCVYCLKKDLKLADHDDIHEGHDGYVKMHFDHKYGDRDWDMRKLGPLQRLKIIEQEAQEGRIQLACASCNSRKNDSDVEARMDDDLARELRGG